MIVVEPGATTVTNPVKELTVANSGFELVNVNAPLLVVVGGVNRNGAAPQVLVSMTKSPYTGEPRPTVSTATTLAAV